MTNIRNKKSTFSNKAQSSQFSPNLWDLSVVLEGVKINIIKKCIGFLRLEILNLDISILNSLRRVMVSELPSISPSEIFIFKNTSLINDEIISHRIGLIPIKVDPRLFVFRSSMWYEKEHEIKNQNNIIVMSLKQINYSFLKSFKKSSKKIRKVMSACIKWNPYGSRVPYQTKTFFNNCQLNSAPNIKHCFLDILISRLKSKQRIFLESHCDKSVGLEHAKYSCVSVVWMYSHSTTVVVKDAESTHSSTNKFLKVLKLSKIKEYTKNFTINFNNLKYKMNQKGEFFTFGAASNNSILNIKRENHYFLCIESIGSLKPEFILIESLFFIHKKLFKFFRNIIIKQLTKS
uniref:DNA-directed RNA polymerase I 40KDa subunit n=1 Tax=Amorphochlora amoebiformis TaxID=1561963 RepID=A0A0H5BHP4_9EUKA|nr:DNA-directed RNA polymerase I 40KDa subunit [Amorphochlora amoebiformis]